MAENTVTSQFARIVPSPSVGEGPCLTRGTQVFVGDQKLGGVTSIVLRADVGYDIWRATIECFVVPPPEVVAEVDVNQQPRESWWQRLVRRFKRKDLDVTTLESRIREFRP